MILLGRDCPLSKCCKMPVCFQFSKDIGGKVICLESLCALNPLDHFFIDPDLIKVLYYNIGIDSQNIQPRQLTRAQFKKLKPTFKKVISNEISKMISRGGHKSLAIREILENTDLEAKALDQFLGSRKLV